MNPTNYTAIEVNQTYSANSLHARGGVCSYTPAPSEQWTSFCHWRHSPLTYRTSSAPAAYWCWIGPSRSAWLYRCPWGHARCWWARIFGKVCLLFNEQCKPRWIEYIVSHHPLPLLNSLYIYISIALIYIFINHF